mmetsp:Transcript_7822/g.12646  ORF Transcript_7822/g.12646 Transcript_7822/m.12646 type:complete len:538 (-) Transcript_7822:39-1652(-)
MAAAVQRMKSGDGPNVLIESLSVDQSKGNGTSEGTGSLSLMHKVKYSLPAFSISLVQVTTGTFVPKFYSDTLHVELSVLGWIAVIVLVVDGFLDPIVGFASDFTRTRWGRRRPYMFFGGFLMSIGVICLLMPPRGLSTSGYVAWAAVFKTFVVVSMTLIRIPWFAFGMELTSQHDEKTGLFAIREVFFIVGTILAASIPMMVRSIVNARHDDLEEATVRKQYIIIGVILSVIVILSVESCVFLVKEPQYHLLAKVSPMSWCSRLFEIFRRYRELFVVIIQDRSSRFLLLSTTCYGAGTYVNAFLIAYYVGYVLGASKHLELLVIIYIVSGVVFVPFWTYLAQKFEKRYVFMATCILPSISMFIGFAILDMGDYKYYAPLVVMAGVSFGGNATIRFSMVSDVANRDYWRRICDKKHTRREGEIQALFDFCSKIFSALLIGPFLLALDRMGYTPNRAQTSQVIFGLKLFYQLVPGCLGILAALLLLPYKLDRDQYHKEEKIAEHKLLTRLRSSERTALTWDSEDYDKEVEEQDDILTAL